jgi:hypothetical protein
MEGRRVRRKRVLGEEGEGKGGRGRRRHRFVFQQNVPTRSFRCKPHDDSAAPSIFTRRACSR